MPKSWIELTESSRNLMAAEPGSELLSIMGRWVDALSNLDEGSPERATVSVRLRAEDIKWLNDNCPSTTFRLGRRFDGSIDAGQVWSFDLEGEQLEIGSAEWLNLVACFYFVSYLSDFLSGKGLWMIRCAQCGLPFVRTRKDRKYCSNACTYDNFQERQGSKPNESA
ncbi:MAG: hypothetical protein DHS20C21_19370 [Gemmatimonadota bacterium]|nr:MAG: hypothetical protein DHS20C21_19370 [Gemmatimonadota bacterium]